MADERADQPADDGAEPTTWPEVLSTLIARRDLTPAQAAWVMRHVLSGEAKVGANVVVVDDVHTQEALSTAELLLEQGKRVEVISPLFYVGQDIGVTSIAPLYKRLFTRGVVLTPGTELRAVEGSTVIVTNVYSGAERRIEAVDTVVLAAGSRSTDGLYRALKGQVAALYAVGDCVAPRGVNQAILDATRVARVI